MITKLPFGNDQLYRITDGPFQAEIVPQGAAVRSLIVPDRKGRPVDVVLGYDSPEEYQNQDACLGAVVGRFAGRIAGGRFSLGGKDYLLDVNEPPNTLHGGREGYHLRRWELAPLGEHSVVCSLRSPDGDQGFPGNLDIQVTYTLENGTFTIRYRAQADADTVVNLTNHSYFNLSGHASGCVGNHILRVNAETFTEIDDTNIPTGAVRAVARTPWDLRQGTVLRSVLLHPALERTQGFDHYFPLTASPAVQAASMTTGIAMDVTTDLPGVQLYTAGFLSKRPGKGGALYNPRQGFCLETQYPPNAVNIPAFPSPVLLKGQVWEKETSFVFSRLGVESTTF